MEHTCSYCGLSFETGPKLGSHKRNCTLNPKHDEMRRKNAESHRKPTQKYTFTCEKCGDSFELDLSDSQRRRKNCGRFCSRSCANFRVISKEQRRKTSETLTGRPYEPRIPKTRQRGFRGTKKCKYCGCDTNSIDGKPTKEYCVPKCGAAKKHTSEVLSNVLKGKTGGYRERGGRGKGCRYKGVWLDSTWELALAQKLDELSISWERDTGRHRFAYVDASGKTRLYFPDFFLPELGCYVEVKGFWTSDVKQKIEDATSRNHLKLIVFDSLSKIESMTADVLRLNVAVL